MSMSWRRQCSCARAQLDYTVIVIDKRFLQRCSVITYMVLRVFLKRPACHRAEFAECARWLLSQLWMWWLRQYAVWSCSKFLSESMALSVDFSLVKRCMLYIIIRLDWKIVRNTSLQLIHFRQVTNCNATVQEVVTICESIYIYLIKFI